MDGRADLSERLWRVRRRHDHIDAVLRPRGAQWELQFFRNNRLMFGWRRAKREAACLEADVKLHELQRAGWTTHW